MAFRSADRDGDGFVSVRDVAGERARPFGLRRGGFWQVEIPRDWIKSTMSIRRELSPSETPPYYTCSV